MRRRSKSLKRRGVFLVLVAILLIPMFGFVALAVDLGMVASARSQAQNAADLAAMAGARELSGNPANNYEYSSAEPTALSAAGNNEILSSSIDTSQVSVQIGRYTYNENQKKFEQKFPGPSTEPWSLVDATVNGTGNYAFAQVFGMNVFNVSAKAVAVHRPRDVAVVADLSGSMRFDSLVGIGYSGDRSMSNNADSLFPKFGPYSDINGADMQNTSTTTLLSGYVYGSANLTHDNNNGEDICEQFGFSTQSSSFVTTPGGDVPLRENENGGSGYASTVSRIMFNDNDQHYDSDWEADGYEANGMSGSFNGYTQGPNYYGKTFFVWPPDPRAANDWRKKFFQTAGGGTISENYDLFESDGDWRDADYYRINYSAILNWIKNTGPNPFPSQLVVGGITYYTAIPSSLSTINTNTNRPTFPDPPSNQTAKNERFWKDYIDFVLGNQQTSSGSTYAQRRARNGYGDHFRWNPNGDATVVYSQPPSVNDSTGSVNQSGGYSAGYTGWINVSGFSSSNVPQIGNFVSFDNGDSFYRVTSRDTSPTRIRVTPALTANASNGQSIQVRQPYMDYRDNPKRPKTQFWFGPMTMVDFLGNYNLGRYWWPGTVHEAPLWQCKIGIQTALQDIKINHPNDYVSLVFFSHPKASANSNSGRFNRVRAPLGQDFDRMINGLWYPLYYLDNGTTITPWESDSDKDIAEVPNAQGATCYPMGLMLAYNQFSSNTSLKTYNTQSGAPVGDAGGLGRKGAAKLIIFETDGNPTCSTNSVMLGGSGDANRYYQVRYPNEFPSGVNTNDESGSESQTDTIVDQITALEADGGYSTNRKPVIIHCIAFGNLFDTNSPNPTDKQAALNRLQQMQYKGGEAGGETPTPTTPLPSYKMITGTSTQRIDKLRKAFIKIMQDGVQVNLVE